MDLKETDVQGIVSCIYHLKIIVRTFFEVRSFISPLFEGPRLIEHVTIIALFSYSKVVLQIVVYISISETLIYITAFDRGLQMIKKVVNIFKF